MDILNIGEFAKPIDTFICKISDAIGVVFEPTQMKRIAKAEIKIDKMKALAKIEAQSIEERAIERLLHKEVKKQENIESIIDSASSQLEEHAEVDKLSKDWLTMFFDKAESFSDEQMRLLWSKILAGEANKAGTFSKRTLEIISNIEKADAQLFSVFCQFLWRNAFGEFLPMIFNEDDKVYSSEGINYESLSHLASIGLITPIEPMSLHLNYDSNESTMFTYFEKTLCVEFPENEPRKFPLGKIMLTRSGKELATISNPTQNDDFYNYIIKRLFHEKTNAKFGLFREDQEGNLTLYSILTNIS